MTGKWSPAGTRPAADCWIVNRTMAAARRLLQKQHRAPGALRPSTAPAATPAAEASRARHTSNSYGQAGVGEPNTVDETQLVPGVGLLRLDDWDQQLEWQQQLEQELAAVRMQEQQEELAQQQLELRASQGLEGPRPCLCVNGREVQGGRQRCSSGVRQRQAVTAGCRH